LFFNSKSLIPLHPSSTSIQLSGEEEKRLLIIIIERQARALLKWEKILRNFLKAAEDHTIKKFRQFEPNRIWLLIFGELQVFGMCFAFF